LCYYKYYFILANRIECEVYHADIPLSKRNAVHENFVKDNLQTVVATVAFGMGIDKPGKYIIDFICFKFIKINIFIYKEYYFFSNYN